MHSNEYEIRAHKTLKKGNDTKPSSTVSFHNSVFAFFGLSVWLRFNFTSKLVMIGMLFDSFIWRFIRFMPNGILPQEKIKFRQREIRLKLFWNGKNLLQMFWITTMELKHLICLFKSVQCACLHNNFMYQFSAFYANWPYALYACIPIIKRCTSIIIDESYRYSNYFFEPKA